MICIPSGNHDMDQLARSIRATPVNRLCLPALHARRALLYYGDEIGMRYIENIPSVEGGYGRTAQRSPMQWDSSVIAGFSTRAQGELTSGRTRAATDPPPLPRWKTKTPLYHEIRRLIAVPASPHGAAKAGRNQVCVPRKRMPIVVLSGSSGDERILVVITQKIVRSASADCACAAGKQLL